MYVYILYFGTIFATLQLEINFNLTDSRPPHSRTYTDSRPLPPAHFVPIHDIKENLADLEEQAAEAGVIKIDEGGNDF
jgi:hypothetical protein